MASYYSCLQELHDQYVEYTNSETGNLRRAARLVPILMQLYGYLHRYYSAHYNEDAAEKAIVVTLIEELFEGESITFDTGIIFS